MDYPPSSSPLLRFFRLSRIATSLGGSLGGKLGGCSAHHGGYHEGSLTDHEGGSRPLMIGYKCGIMCRILCGTVCRIAHPQGLPDKLADAPNAVATTD